MNKQKKQAGSPQSGEPVYLAVGRLRRAHGVKGEILMEVLTDFPERLQAGGKVYVGPEHELRNFTTVRSSGNLLLVAFEGIDTPESSRSMRNQLVYIRSDQLPPLPEGEYYYSQLLGLSVLNEDGEALGILEEILETGANDVYLVRLKEGGELLLPAIDPVIRSVDLERKEIHVRAPEWD